MKEYLRKFFIYCFEIALDQKVPRISRIAYQEMTKDLFAYVGIERLKMAIEEAQQRGDTYISLAEIYGRIIRDNLAKENSDIIHSYYELLPKLDQYKQSLNKVTE